MNCAASTFCLLGLLALLGSCAAPSDAAFSDAEATTPARAEASAEQPTQAQTLQVTATTSLIADIVREVGGEHVAVSTLVPVDGDPHGFSPTPASMRTLSGSAALFANGAGLEGWLPQVQDAAEDVPTFVLSDGLKLHAADVEHPEEAHVEAEHDEHETEAEHGEHGNHEHHEHEHGEYDPHAWWNPAHAIAYAEAAASALAQLDPAHAEAYHANAEAFAAQVREIDDYGAARFAGLPAGARRVATEHDSLGYFARHYGLAVVGSVLPSLSTEGEPSARELAALSTQMQAEGARVLLTGEQLPSRLVDAVARETGAEVVQVYTDALGASGTEGATYLGALRWNINAVADALEAAEQASSENAALEDTVQQ